MIKVITLSCSLLLLAACSFAPQRQLDRQQLALPDSWRKVETAAPVEDSWLALLNLPGTDALVAQALAENQQLQQQAYAVAILRQQLAVQASSLWPSLDVSLTQQRSKAINANDYTNNAAIDLNLEYELDVWGKLSASKRSAHWRWQAGQASYQQARLQLVADVVDAWLNVLEIGQRITLIEQRVANAEKNQKIIKAGYRRGLSSALDVYLVQNELSTQRSSLANQQANRLQALRTLERLTGQYPAASLVVSGELPLLTSDIPLGLPSQLLSRRPSLVASWNNLLASDAALAFAHRARFPSVTLSASLGDTGNELNDLLIGNTLSRSFIGGVTAPLFNAGRLKANQEVARLQLRQAEQSYLDELYNAFAEVENAIGREAALKNIHQTQLRAQKSAIAAAELAFSQYRKGLVSITTVLDAQARSFEAQNTLIQTKRQLLSNRVQLHRALGGYFEQQYSNSTDTSGSGTQ